MELKTARHTPEELKQVAQIHMTQLDLGFLSSLGEKTLVLMYKTISKWENSCLVTANQNGRVVGFVAGALNINSLYTQFLLRDFFGWIGALAPKLSPKNIWRIIEVIIYPSKQDSGPAVPKAELLTLAVSNEMKGTGCAAKLYEELANYFREKQQDGFRIMVGENLTRAQAFYAKMGATKHAGTEVHEGEKSFILVQWLR